MIKHSPKGPTVQQAQEPVQADQTDRTNQTAGTLVNGGRWVQACTPPAPRWR